MNKLAVIGAGYVGLVTGICLASCGHDVTCMDIDECKIDQLKAGRLPLFEPGLQELHDTNTATGRLSFTTNPEKPSSMQKVCSSLSVHLRAKTVELIYRIFTTRYSP